MNRHRYSPDDHAVVLDDNMRIGRISETGCGEAARPKQKPERRDYEELKRLRAGVADARRAVMETRVALEEAMELSEV